MNLALGKTDMEGNMENRKKIMSLDQTVLEMLS